MKLVQDIDLSPFMEDDGVHQKVRRPAEFEAKVLEELDDARAQSPMVRLPFTALHGKFDLRPGETTVWGGQNGTGKTHMMSQVLHAIGRQGQATLLASFELAPPRSIRRLLRQAFRTPNPTPEYVSRWMRWTDGRLWILDHQGSFGAARMLALLRWVVANLPAVRHVIVDSLMKLEIAPDDYAGQKSLINRLHSLAMETGLHIHLVAHARKGEREGTPTDKFSIKGASEIVDQVDNLVILNRNLAKERRIEQWRHECRNFDTPTDDMRDTLSQWDAGLRVAKQRHGEWEGGIPLWFDRRALAYSDQSDAIAPGIPMNELSVVDCDAPPHLDVARD
jgi:twinkle protein